MYSKILQPDSFFTKLKKKGVRLSLLSSLLIILMIPLTEAQDSLECHVQWDTIETSYYDIPQSLNQSTTPIYVKVYFTIVREDDGTGGYSPNDIGNLKTIMDNEFNQHDIYFQYECNPDYLDNSERLYNGLHSRIDLYCEWEPVPKKQDGLQIFVLNEINDGSANWNASGIAGDIPGTWMVVGSIGSDPIRESTLIHEVGHCLGLLHTFHGWTKNPNIYCSPIPDPLPYSEAAYDCPDNFIVDENECAELVDGSNGNICGDYIYDTPASTRPHERYTLFQDCTPTGEDVYNNVDQKPVVCELIRDPNGQQYQPDLSNYMALTMPKHCRDNFTPGQVDVMRNMLNNHPDLQSLVRTETEVANTCPCPSGDIEIVDNPHVINTDMELADNIIVKTGAHLTISSNIEFNENKGIIVERGAKLIVDGGTLTKCPNADSWEGIYVEGVHDAVQPNYDDMPTSGQAGIVWTKNGAKIEYATVGIRTMKYGQSWNDQYWGGVIHCTHTEFLNNRKGVEFMKYGFPANNYSNNSAFRYCTFKKDGNYSFSSVPVGITIWDCDEIRIQRCNFLSLYYGLSGIDFSSIITNANLFKDCRYAVKSRASNPFASALQIGDDITDPNIFHNNFRSIWMQANDYLNGAEIENNDIYVSSTYSLPLSNHNGLYIEGPNYFKVQENNFTDYSSAAVISHTGIDRNYFRCNTIGNDEDLDAEGLVIRNRNDYLQFLSNTFVIPFDCKPDVRIYGSQYLGTVEEEQGEINRPAGNCFTKQGGRLEIEAVDNTRFFKYWLEQEYIDYCVLPTDNLSDGGVNNYELRYTDAIDENCDAQTGSGGEITTTSTNVTLDGGGENSGDGDYDTLRYQINSEWNAGNYQNAIQILLNDGSPHALRIAFGMYIKLGDYVSADSLLNVILSNNAMDDTPEFYAIQTINLRRLNAIGDTTGFELTQAEYDTLYSIAQGETYSATYSKSLLDFLEGVNIDFIPNPDCVEDDEGQAGLRESSGIKNSASISIKLWPTPANDVISYEILNLGDRIIQSVQLISSKGQSFSMNGIGESTQIDIAKFPSGIYIFEFQFDDGTKESKRFIKL